MKIPTVPRKRQITTDAVRAYRLAGLSLREIAARLSTNEGVSVSQEAVRKALARSDGRPPITLTLTDAGLLIQGAPDQLDAAKAIARHFTDAGFPVEAHDKRTPPNPTPAEG